MCFVGVTIATIALNLLKNDLRLCRYFSLSDGYFLRLQNAYDLMEAKKEIQEEKPLILSKSNLINDENTDFEKLRVDYIGKLEKELEETTT